MDIYDAEPYSQTPALDVVLAGKMLTCNSLGINITCMADGRRLDFMEDCDVYALFGNILDNAIEAVRQVEDPELHVITLTVDTKDDFLIIECENYFSGKLVFDDGLPLTTKTDNPAVPAVHSPQSSALYQFNIPLPEKLPDLIQCQVR